MYEQLFAFGVRQLFGGARRGQPVITALGAAITIWGLFRKLDRRHKPIYTRNLRDGEMVRVRMWRGGTALEPSDPI